MRNPLQTTSTRRGGSTSWSRKKAWSTNWDLNCVIPLWFKRSWVTSTAGGRVAQVYADLGHVTEEYKQHAVPEVGIVGIGSIELFDSFDYLVSFYSSISRTALHSGYPIQPQNSLPAFFPLLAWRRFIGLPQSGQAGADSCFALASTLILVSFSRNPPSKILSP